MILDSYVKKYGTWRQGETYQEMLDTSSDENPQRCKARRDRNDGAGKLFLLRASQFCEPQTCSTALLQLELLVCIIINFFLQQF